MEANKTKIEQTVSLLFLPGETIELRSIGDRVCNGYYRDQGKLAQDALELSNAGQNVYVCLNPVLPELYARRADEVGRAGKGEGTTDQNVLNRRWLFIDIDPVRPSGVSATDQQKHPANELAKQVYAYLKNELGGNCLVVADSGNGAHILIRLPDVPADDESDWVCERTLHMLDRKFSNTEVHIDLKTHNASRICTLYGTVKRKGNNIPEQPHRLSRLVHVPDQLQPAAWQKLTSLTDPYLGELPAEQQSTNNGSTWNLEQILNERQIQYTRDDDYHTKNGELATRYELRICPFNPDHNDRSAYLIEWPNGAVCFGCHHNGCSGNDWQALKNRWDLSSGNNISAADIVMPRSSQRQTQIQNVYVPPPAPTAAFYGPIGDLVMNFAPRTEASPAALLLTALTHFGNAIGRRYYVDIGTRQYLKLFTALVGTTSRGRKWTAEENVVRMTDAINPAWSEYRHSGLASGEGMIQVVAENMEGAYPAPAIFTEGEFALVLRKKERKGNSLDGYLRVAWDDAVLSTSTRKDPLRVEGSHISLMVHITPGELKELLSGRDISNGFANRFLWCWSSRSARVPDANSFDPGDARYQPQIQKLRTAFDQLEQRYQGQPIRLQLDSQALAEWPRIYAYLDSVESDEDEGLLVDLNARSPAYAQRIAGIYALADGATEIGIAHLRAAVAITNYSLATVDYVYSKQWWTDGNRSLDLIKQRAAKVVNELPLNQAVKRSEVSHRICKRNRSAAELNQLRDYLTGVGSLRVEQVGKAEHWTRVQ